MPPDWLIQLQQEADRCVRCGLCLPHCPTYGLDRQEAESPRGRIALWQGIASEQLPVTDKMTEYLDHCLGCRACESVCPAEVAYENLMVAGRRLQQQKSPLKIATRRFWLRKTLSFLLLHRRWLQLLHNVFPFAFSAVVQSNNNIVKRKNYPIPQVTEEVKRVQLMPGCIHSVFDKQTLEATRHLLTACGYQVIQPMAFRCCGAWHAHAGEAEQAQRLQQENRELFNSQLPILSTATGCTPELKKTFPHAQDILAFLLNSHQFQQQKFQPLVKKALVHIPCTQRHGLQQAELPFQLLQKIPQLQLIATTSTACCGGAGSYFLEFPARATAFAAPLVQQILNEKVDLFITSNIGCALHVQQQLRKVNCAVPVLHPVTVLANQLSDAEKKGIISASPIR